MKTIYKYPLEHDENNVELPIGAQILSVINQNDTIIVYALVDTEAKKSSATFYVFGTGWNMGSVEDMVFIGTVQIDLFSWHVFFKR